MTVSSEENNYTAIILDTSHRTAVIDLIKSRQRFSKQESNSDILAVLEEGTDLSLNNGKQIRLIGCFEGNSLEAILCQTFSSVNPAWIMRYYASRYNNIILGKGYGPYISACFRKAMDDAEQMGIYDFWWSIPEAYAKNGPRLQQKSPEWIRYEVYTDAVIPPNTFPKYEVHKTSYGKILKPHTVFIRHAVLKQEFRNVPLTRQHGSD
jgi:hypothetical protein